MKNDTLDTVARIGFVAKGAIYLMIGALAALWAFGSGGQLTGGTGVVHRVEQMPAGTVLLVLLAFGLASYALFRTVQATARPRTDEGGKAVARRAGRAGSAVVHGFLAFTCIQALGQSSSGGGDKKTYLGAAIASDWGRWLVIALGAAIVVAAFYQAYKVVSSDIGDELETHRMGPTMRRWTIRLGHFGLAARALVFFIIGAFLVDAGLSADASEAKTTGGALYEIAQQSYGIVLLTLVGLGLAAYGVYMVVSARYRRPAA